ncbi:MAG: response regulator [Mesorhizobium sp.]|uniref:response regulator transcription factor n=1 Tax=Mesorhizobium sp. TaxID=1871066 RepID=UPI000FE857E3|nr:response regulator transcription factor [Mesorhizobium sp.]RWC00351.1 MAG: response regulator [Mesorhizobium sp.]
MEPVAIICSQDAELYIILEYILGLNGHKTLLAGNIEEAMERARETSPVTVVLDCRPNGLPVATLCAQLKEDPTTRAILLVALIAPGAEDQHIQLLKAGVDDSLVRPLVPAKLLASLRSRRATGARSNVHSHNILSFGAMELRPESLRVRHGEREMQLGTIEFRLLRHLLENPREVFSREDLIAIAWPNNIHVDTRTVDVHVSRLRKSLQKLGPGVSIRTVRSAGYMLDDTASSRAADPLPSSTITRRD